MTFSALDSTVLGPLFATEARPALFDDTAFIAAMLRAEVARGSEPCQPRGKTDR